MRRSTLVAGAAIVAVALLAAWLYASPYVVIDRVRRAAERGDADTVNAHVDFPAVRQSVRTWLEAATAQGGGEGRAHPLGSLGRMLGPGMTDRIADALVTPETVRQLLQGRVPRSVSRGGGGGGRRAEEGSEGSPETKVEMRYESWNRFVVTVRRPRRPQDEVGLVWRRDGLSWVLAGVRLPTG